MLEPPPGQAQYSNSDLTQLVRLLEQELMVRPSREFLRLRESTLLIELGLAVHLELELTLAL